MITEREVLNEKVKIIIYEYDGKGEFNEREHKFPFIISDAISYMIKEKKPFKICYIYNFDMEQDQKEIVLKEVVKKYEKDYLILAEAYISTTEFPEDKYYLEEKDQTENKKQIPLDDILEREMKVLGNCGFVDVNHFLAEYQFKVSFMYKNDIGKELKNMFYED